MQDRVGQQLGNYRLTALIGTGGYADVYLAEHLYISNRQHAIKVLNGTDLEEYNQDEFLLEAQTITNLQHLSSHIVQINDVGIQTSKEAGVTSYTPYIVMEYAPKGTLRSLYPSGTQVPLERIVFYTNQIAEALQCAHDHSPPVIHRDVKPENMLLRTPDHVLLSDFGISISGKTGPQRISKEKGVVGTAAYIAPERFSGHMRRASDQYSLGIVVYEWISGERPFDGTGTEICAKHLTVPPPPLYPTYARVTPEISEVVARALEKKPDNRYPTVQAFAHALESAVEAARKKSQTISLPVEEVKSIVDVSVSSTIPAPPSDMETARKVLRIPKAQPASSGGQQAGIVTNTHLASTTEALRPQRLSMQSVNVDPVRPPLRKEQNVFDLSSQFAYDQRYSFFLNAGIVLNVLSALILGLLLRNLFVLFGGLLLSWLLFTLCVRAVEEKLALFFGIALACYWAGTGYVIGKFLASLLHLTTYLPPLFVGGVFFLISLGLHIWYVSQKNL